MSAAVRAHGRDIGTLHPGARHARRLQAAAAVAVVWLRRLCFVCFCALLLAVAILALELILVPQDAPRFALGPATCQFHSEILPNFTCSGGGAPFAAFILNLPLLFIYAPLFTLTRPAGMNPDFIRFLYPFAAVLVLGLAWPLLALMARKKRKDGSA